MNDDRQQRNMERLEQKRRAINARLDSQRARLNARFDQKQAELGGKLNLRQEQIVAAALKQLSVDGLNNLSLREVARSLKIQAPALYWYFKSKEDLIDHMAEAILASGFKDLQPRRDDETWQDWLVAHMSKLRKAMLAYPDGARVVAGAHLLPAVTLARSFEASLISLTSAGIEPHVARHIIMTATTYTFGFVIEEQAAPTAEQLANVDLTDFFKAYPNMAKVAAEAYLETGAIKDSYLTGLGYIINGSTTPAAHK